MTETKRSREYFVKHSFLWGNQFSCDLLMSLFLLEHGGFYYQRSPELVNHRENSSYFRQGETYLATTIY